MTFPLSLHPDVNNISQRPMRERGRPACHPPLLPHALRFSAFYALFSSTTASLALSARTSCCIIGNFTLCIWRCKGGLGGGGGWERKEGMVWRVQLKASGSAQAPFFHLNWFQRMGKQNQVIRTARCLATSCNTKAALFPSAGVSVSLDSKTTSEIQAFFFFFSKSLFVQSEHIGDQPWASGRRSKRNPGCRSGARTTHFLVLNAFCIPHC